MLVLCYTERDGIDNLPCHAETGVMTARRTAKEVLAEKCILLVWNV